MVGMSPLCPGSAQGTFEGERGPLGVPEVGPARRVQHLGSLAICVGERRGGRAVMRVLRFQCPMEAWASPVLASEAGDSGSSPGCQRWGPQSRAGGAGAGTGRPCFPPSGQGERAFPRPSHRAEWEQAGVMVSKLPGRSAWKQERENNGLLRSAEPSDKGFNQRWAR